MVLSGDIDVMTVTEIKAFVHRTSREIEALVEQLGWIELVEREREGMPTTSLGGLTESHRAVFRLLGEIIDVRSPEVRLAELQPAEELHHDRIECEGSANSSHDDEGRVAQEAAGAGARPSRYRPSKYRQIESVDSKKVTLCDACLKRKSAFSTTEGNGEGSRRDKKRRLG